SICVIDDDPIHQLIIRKMISHTGIFENAVSFENTLEAINHLNKSQSSLPDLILLDLNMEEMNGWQFIEYLRSYRPNLAAETTIYIVTSSIAAADRKKAKTYKEISGFLSKPVGIEKLKEIGQNL